MTRAAFAALTVLVAGCASPVHYGSWEGEDVQSMMRAWGAPYGSARLSNDHVVYAYRPGGACHINVETSPAGAVLSVSAIGRDCEAPMVAANVPPP